MNAQPSRRSRIASRTLQVVAAAVVMAGAGPGEMWTLPLYGVAILAVPPVVGRWCRSRLRPLQRAWVSVGLAVHPAGAIYGLYTAVWWYDHLAHLASASLLTGLAYLVVVGVLGDSRRAPVSPGAHLAVLLAVVTAAVSWELLELQVAYLRVPGPEDTVADISYNLLGFLAVAPRVDDLLAQLTLRPG